MKRLKRSELKPGLYFMFGIGRPNETYQILCNEKDNFYYCLVEYCEQIGEDNKVYSWIKGISDPNPHSYENTFFLPCNYNRISDPEDARISIQGD